MKEIYLIRHGNSEGNADSTVYDRKPDSEIELTPLGKKQASELADKFKSKMQNSTFFHSPFLRAEQTMNAFGRILGYYTSTEVKNLIEMQWKGHFSEKLEQKSLKSFLSEDGYFFKFPNGESGEEVFKRVSRFKEYLFDLDKQGKLNDNVFVFGHGMAIQLLLIALVGEEEDCSFKNFQTTYLKNCEYHKLEKQNGLWKKTQQ